MLTLMLAAAAALPPAPALALQGDIEDAAPPAARAELERFASGLDTFYATFEQRVLDRDGETQDASGGELWLSRPQLFRWEYHGDFPEVIVADGERVWIYDVTLEQVTVKDQSSLANDSPLTLLTDISRLDEQFEVRELGEYEGMALLELRSITADSEFDRVLLGIEDGELRMMAMEDAFGLRTEITFKETDRNPTLEKGLFQFEPPEGTDVVGDLGDLAEAE